MTNPNISALIVQGGGQKGAFSAGVLDQFKRHQFDPFSLYLGTSAGALNIAAFIAGQTGLALDFIINYTTNQRFFDFNKFVNKQQPMDLDWAFQFVEQGEFPLDIQKGKAQLEKLHLGRKREALACVTHVEELKDYYYPIFEDNWFDILRATSAIPVLYFDDIEFDGATWVDGGVTSTIPVQEAYKRGAKELVVITTDPILTRHEVAPTPMENTFSKLSLEVEIGLDLLIQRYGLVGHVERLNEFEQQFTQAIGKVKQRYPSLVGSNDKSWAQEAEKLANLIKVQSEKRNFSGEHTKKMEMLVSHYLNHESVKEFMREPPVGVTIHEIAPLSPLLSKGLLSGKDEILSDYQQGLLAGKEYLERHHDQSPH
ncbi:patatin family protein [Vibrio sp. ZSDE26]|uniref:Patatin family protein n=1 Tax=Vibrio amylolyticus TaxID=2847292 RepID=A0A9X1XM98_9VIBR|nr:patatin family protein [Vibrio amylolyticus]MCK6263515.1 patatin family protein [Vibrio amylolyticus]